MNHKKAKEVIHFSVSCMTIAHCEFLLVSVRFRVNFELGILFTKTFNILPETIMEYRI